MNKIIYQVCELRKRPIFKIVICSNLAVLRYSVVDIPEELTTGIHRYLDTAGLVFGAFDFLVEAVSETIFLLECNASGQFGWLAEACDLPIAAALAEELLGEL